jgi:hypothetical protein
MTSTVQRAQARARARARQAVRGNALGERLCA